MTIPVSAVIPTRDRSTVLAKALTDIMKQNVQFDEIIIVDSSSDDKTKYLCDEYNANSKWNIRYFKALEAGAATQRNQGVSESTQPFICFMDDDVYLEDLCLERLWKGISTDPQVGGINAMITNQKYIPLGKATRFICRIINGRSLASYAGKCIGPAYNFLPDDNEGLAEYVPVDWLNLGCTIYRREVLPAPPFPGNFKGYSMMEDLTLSLTVGKSRKLLNARNARLYHDSQPGDYKQNIVLLEKMELVNRHFIMTKVLNRTAFSDYLKLFLLESFFIVSLATSFKKIKRLPESIWGKLSGIKQIIFNV